MLFLVFILRNRTFVFCCGMHMNKTVKICIVWSKALSRHVVVVSTCTHIVLRSIMEYANIFLCYSFA